jgi:hypothetical protein
MIMPERRPLIEGIKSLGEDIDPELAEEFVYDKKLHSPAKPPVPAPHVQAPPAEALAAPKPLPESLAAAAQVASPLSPLTGIGRVPVGARVRTELAAQLKRASLERQLQGIQPNSVQDILENALELWLHKQGYLN